MEKLLIQLRRDLCAVYVCDSCADSPDYVLIRDGVDETSPVLARYCGHLPAGDVIPAVVTSSNRATVEFVSDARNERQGFAGIFTFVASDASPTKPVVSAMSDVTTHVTTVADHQADHRLLQPEVIPGKLP